MSYLIFCTIAHTLLGIKPNNTFTSSGLLIGSLSVTITFIVKRINGLNQQPWSKI